MLNGDKRKKKCGKCNISVTKQAVSLGKKNKFMTNVDFERKIKTKERL